eukprot:9469610-Pyramimonas_sp.AAC.1
MGLDMFRRCCWIASVAAVGFVLPLGLFAPDDRAHIGPRRLRYAFCSAIMVTLKMFPKLMTPSRLHF